MRYSRAMPTLNENAAIAKKALWPFLVLALALCSPFALTAQSPAKKPPLPVLAGTDALGRVFLWQEGVKLFVTDPWETNVLVGGELVSADKSQSWNLRGYTVEEPLIRFWNLTLELGKPAKPEELAPVKRRTFLRDDFGVERPDFGAKQGDTLALLYGSASPLPRWELWKNGLKVQAKTWDDGRIYTSVAVNSAGQALWAGRSSEGAAFVESPSDTFLSPVPGRVSALSWNPLSDPPGWVAVGWGALVGQPPAFLVWQGEQWLVAATKGPPLANSAGVLSQKLAFTAKGELLAAGIVADKGGLHYPWIWEPSGGRVLELPFNPTLHAFSASGDAGWFLVVQDADGAWSLVSEAASSRLEGLGETDKVVFAASVDSGAPATQ